MAGPGPSTSKALDIAILAYSYAEDVRREFPREVESVDRFMASLKAGANMIGENEVFDTHQLNVAFILAQGIKDRIACSGGVSMVERHPESVRELMAALKRLRDALARMGAEPSRLSGGGRSTPGSTSGDRWYFADDKARGLRQIVFEFGGKAPTESHFSGLMLNPHKYSGLLSDLAVGFFKTDANPGPYLLVKTPSWSRVMSEEAVRVGFTFCNMPSGPVFAVFLQSPTTEKRCKGACFLDQTYSMDEHSGLDDLITDAFRKETLTVVFADSGGMPGINCICEAEYDVDGSLRELFGQEWSSLTAHGRKTPGWSQGSFAASREELYARTPMDQSPILRR